ncbi:hypothetical protein B0A48_15246 [Cryoendolithus antarcticus]|uniref:CUE domain-containing protein n=1 Tax=Cryoendolithus antarcticus TaxID=1507870 RepID=A0A1V8SIW5_9PEZI|nr:hypothetical protein B0A48_15246 [Cryoendolithus antarcticus]
MIGEQQQASATLPQLAAIPPSNVRQSLESAEWEACLDAWLTLAEVYLASTTTQFQQSLTKGSLSPYLRSHCHELAHIEQSDGLLRAPKARALTRTTLALIRRAFLEVDDLSSLLDLEFLSDLCRPYLRSSRLSDLLDPLWKRKAMAVEKLLQSSKQGLIRILDSSTPDAVESQLAVLAPILRVSFQAATVIMTGSDLLDSFVTAYTKTTTERTRKAIVITVYLGLTGSLSGAAGNSAMVADHLYSLKTQLEGRPPHQSPLADLVTNTPLLAKLRRSVGEKSPERLLKLIESLETFRAPSIARTKKHSRSVRKTTNGRSGHQDELHMHRMSLVTQVQDLFPDLGSGFVMRLLDAYDDDVEQVTAHLLDNSLPPDLGSLDRTEKFISPAVDPQQAIDHLAPRSTPPPSSRHIPSRRNVYDNDDLDRLEFDTSRLHMGKKDKVADVSTSTGNKAAILSALAAFDSDDDERDDTYDVEDVGGTVDTAHPDGEPGPAAKVTQEENDAALFTAYKDRPELFGRTQDVRRGQARAALKRETGMTDEAIEGWAIMLQRDPRRLRKLETQSSAFDGRQADVARTAYRESPAGTETEDSDVPGENGRGGFAGRGRGRGRGGRGGGASVAGPSSDPATANAQRRKEASKGSRANHNRRDGRARKTARGGFTG